MKWFALAGVLLVAWLSGVALWIANPPAASTGQKADVAIVLGAAVIGDRPSPVFAARIDHAIDLYRDDKVEGLIFTGGRSPEDELSEAGSARNYAAERGIPASAIRIETVSRTTRQNLAEARRLMREAKAQSAVIVSDPLHVRRASVLASSLGIEHVPGATPYTRYRSLSTRMPFLAREVFFLHYFWLTGE